MGQTQQRSRKEDGDDLLNPPVISWKIGERYWFSSTLPHPSSVLTHEESQVHPTQHWKELLDLVGLKFLFHWNWRSLDVLQFKQLWKARWAVLWITVLYLVPVALNLCIHLEEKYQRKNSTQAFIDHKSLWRHNLFHCFNKSKQQPLLLVLIWKPTLAEIGILLRNPQNTNLGNRSIPERGQTTVWSNTEIQSWLSPYKIYFLIQVLPQNGWSHWQSLDSHQREPG